MSFFDSIRHGNAKPVAALQSLGYGQPQFIQRILNMSFIRCNALNKSLILIE
ncbi:hypothetical protein [Methanobrevibacter sp.]|uniref:hypothetical protein n=1 Tax=Methanobrevibacter sp. TaxID=66852 RepID=UPI00386380C2